MSNALQSSTPKALLDAVQTVLERAAGLNSAYVIENYDTNPPDFPGEPYYIIFRLRAENPFPYDGAGRIGGRSYWMLEIMPRIRLATDRMNTDQLKSRDENRGLLAKVVSIQNAIQNKMLYSSYDPDTGEPTGQPLTIEPANQVSCPDLQKPLSDRSVLERSMFFQLTTVQPVNAASFV